MGNEWLHFTLGDLCSLITDGKHGDCLDEPDSGFYFLSVKDVVGNRLVYDTARQIAERDFAETHQRTNLEPGDVLFTNTGTIGRMAIAKNDPKTYRTTFQKSVAILKPKRDVIDPHFLYYLLQFDNAKLSEFAAGTTQKNLLLKDLRSFAVQVPPIPEQRAIVRILSMLDDKIALNLRMNETLEAMAQALFEKLKNESGGRKKLDDLVEINSQTLRKQDQLDLIDYIEISEVSRGNIGTRQVFKRGKEPSRARRKLRHGDTVLSTVRPDRRSYFLCLNPHPNLIASTGFAVVSPIKAPWSFIHAALTQEEVFDYLGQQADGGAYPAVRPEIVGQLEVPWPGDSDVVEEFHNACVPLYERAEHNRCESRTLAALRDALLPELLSGRLTVTESVSRIRKGE